MTTRDEMTSNSRSRRRRWKRAKLQERNDIKGDLFLLRPWWCLCHSWVDVYTLPLVVYSPAGTSKRHAYPWVILRCAQNWRASHQERLHLQNWKTNTHCHDILTWSHHVQSSCMLPSPSDDPFKRLVLPFSLVLLSINEIHVQFYSETSF